MKKNGHPTEVKAAADSTPAIITSKQSGFTIKGPREARALCELLRRPAPREVLDKVAGCSNGPALVAHLREGGLDVPCERVPCLDRDGKEVRRGIYSLTKRDRWKAYGAFAAWAKGGAQSTNRGNRHE